MVHEWPYCPDNTRTRQVTASVIDENGLLARCERCGHVPKYMLLLEVVNIDIFNEINDSSNWMTLCLNCKAFITAMNDDDLSPGEREEVREAWKQGELFN